MNKVFLLTLFFTSILNNISFAINQVSDFEMVIQNGHSILVSDAAFSSDGKYIATCGDNTVKLWSIDGSLIKTFQGHTFYVNSVDFSPDGKWIVSGSMDETIILWSIEDNRVIKLEGHESFVESAKFSPDGNYIVSCSWDDTIKLWKKDGELINTFTDHTEKISSVNFSPDGKQIISCSDDRTIKLWDLDGNLLKNINAHDDAIYDVIFSSDDQYIISCSRDKTIKIWDRNLELLNTISTDSTYAWDLEYSPKNNFIASYNQDQKIRLWDMNGELLKIFGEDQSSFIILSPDEQFLASAEHRDLNLWDIDTHLVKSFRGLAGYIYDLSISPDGKNIAAASLDNTIKLWDNNGRLIRVLTGHEESVNSVAFSPDGKYLVSGSGDNSIKLWDRNGNLLRSFDDNLTDISSVAFSPDSKFIVSGSKAFRSEKELGNSIKLWDIEGNLINSIPTGLEAISHVRFSPDGNQIYSSIGSKIVVWDFQGREIRNFGNYSGYTFDFSPDGKYLISNFASNVKYWSIEGDLIKKFEKQDEYINTVAFSPDGQYIISAGKDYLIKLWSLDGRVLKKFQGHEDSINSIIFSSDGKYIISGSYDSSIIMWRFDNDDFVRLLSYGNEWIMYTNDGLFDSSRNGGELLSMVDGLNPYRIDQFAIKYNRPDLIYQRMELGDENAIENFYSLYEKRYRRLGLQENINAGSNELHVPETVITQSSQIGKFLDLSFSLSDNKFDLIRYNIYINDVPLYGSLGIEVDGNNLSLTEKIELTSGTNKIEVSCINDRGSESFRALTFAEYKEEVKGDLYFLGFGISLYEDESLNLKYADKDVLDLADVFSKMKGKNYNDVYIHTYINEEVSVENIIEAKELLNNSQVDDTFVLYISGHGVYDFNDIATYYYLTYGADINDLQGSCVSFEMIEDLLQNISPRNKLFLIDTCESGEIDEAVKQEYYAVAGSKGLTGRTTRGLGILLNPEERADRREYLYERDRYIYNDLIRRSGAIVFSSSRGGELSYESDKIENGVFTEQLIQSLTNVQADINEDGIISESELIPFVSSRVSDFTDGLQNPTVDRDNIYLELEFPLLH